MSRGLAIDLGSSQTRVWLEGRGVVFDEPSVIAVHQRTGAVLEVGEAAFDAVADASGHVVAERPLRSGVVSDFESTTALLELVLDKVADIRIGRRPRVLLSVSSSSTNVERRAIEEAVRRAGAGKIHLVDQPLAAAIGARLPIEDALGSMMVDVGGGRCEVAVIALGGIVASRAVRVGGHAIDEAIQRYVRDTHGLAIGDRTAEEVKFAIGSAAPLEEGVQAAVRGRELSTGLAHEVVLDAEEVREAIEGPVSMIVNAVLGTLADCPPELTHDAIEQGMWLTGGGSILEGLDSRLARESNLAVHHVADPFSAVIEGIGAMLEAFEEYTFALRA